ncbi:MAG: multicopper oxidase domain-containing protein [Actinobacteria bacterium]|nr:multicopper oxidase domain-containing protein [Actinomycetota bacterium]
MPKTIRTTFALFLLVSLVAVACAKDEDAGTAQPDAAGTAVSGEIEATPVVEVEGAHVATLTLTEFAIGGDLTVPAGQVVLSLVNKGAIDHNVRFDGDTISPDIAAGGSATLDLGNLEPGTYELLCEIAGHKEAGMVTTLTVVDDDGTMAASDGHGHDDEIDWAEMDRIMLESIRAFPAETEGVGNEALEPTVLADGTREFHITAEITPWEVEPGRIVDAWTYNGQVPGPTIRVEDGDKVRVVLDNQLPLGTDIHWHGIQTPNSMDGVAPLTQDLVESGDSFVYEFVAEGPRVGMYHAHHMGHMAIPNGLFGVFTIGEVALPLGRTISGIEIPDVVEVAQRIPMVLNDAGVIGYSLNGKSFPATQPYVATVGDWIVVDYYNEGLQIHPMHMHQFPQVVFAKDGFPLDHPYAADTINVAPGERYSVLVQVDTPGVWVWHCHILSHVERDSGMFGMVTAIIVQEA